MSSSASASVSPIKQRLLQKEGRYQAESSQATKPTPTDKSRAAAERIPFSILAKLGVFSMLMIVVPVASYFGTQRYLFKGTNEIYSAIIAIVLANILLILYIGLAVIEEREEQEMHNHPSKQKIL